MKATIAIITRDRPQLFARALDSVIEHLNAHGQPAEILAFDQSELAAAQLNQAALAKARRSGLVSLTHIDDTVRERFIDNLAAKSGVERALIGHGLAPKGQEAAYGANRNLATLMLAGHHFVSLDDDVCLLPHEVDFRGYQVRPTLLPWTIWATEPATRSSPQLTASNACILTTLLDFHPAQAMEIEFSSCGVIGHSGLRSHASLIRGLDDAALHRALLSERSLEALMDGSSVVRMSDSRREWGFTGFLTTIFGCRNQRPLVPFMPAGRGEDHVLGEIISRTLPRIGVRHEPLAVPHTPLITRRMERGIATVEAAHIWGAIVEFLAAGTAISVEHLGERMIEFSKRPLWVREDLANCVRQYCRKQADAYWSLALQWCGPPLGFVALDEQATRWNELERRITHQGWPLSEDCAKWSNHLSNFGHLLIVWRDLWLASARIGR